MKKLSKKLKKEWKSKKLSKKLKKEWIAALRSGEYKQCMDRLHNGVGFCCLGVLADINEDGYWMLPDDQPDDSRQWVLRTRSNRHSKLYGDRLEIPTGTLAAMNDGGTSFSDIADWIEKNL